MALLGGCADGTVPPPTAAHPSAHGEESSSHVASAPIEHGEHGEHVPAAGTLVYTCPMHADVTSDKPGQCPKCGMNLAPKK